MSIAGVIKKIFGNPQPAVVPAVEPAESVRSSQWISNPWHAVGIIPCRQACAAAQSEVGARYLSSEAPTLPLTGCTASSCQCRYRHYNDRRHELRRTADVWSSGRAWNGRERRLQRGRRADDH